MRIITAGTVLPGPEHQRIQDGAVLLDGDTIAEVGPRHELEHHPGAQHALRDDYPDATITPGLVNAHIHLALDTSMDPVHAVTTLDDEDLLLGMAGRAQQLLDAGVTTARDLGDRDGLALRVRDAIARGDLLGPRIVSAGAPITTPEGHCWFLGGVVDSPAAIRKRVEAAAAAGVDLIKVMASGGSLTPNSPPMWQSQFDENDLRVLVDAAAAAGLPVAAHAHGTAAIRSAVEVGVRSIEHCTWLGQDGPDRRDDIARRMADQGIYACAASSRNWRTILEADPGKAEQIYSRLTWLDSLGVPLITGTDAGLPRSGFGDFVGALQLYTYLGFHPARVLEMATTTSAEALGLGESVGQLAPGYNADLLVVTGDPTHDLDTLRNRQLLLVRGRQAQASISDAAPPDRATR